MATGAAARKILGAGRVEDLRDRIRHMFHDADCVLWETVAIANEKDLHLRREDASVPVPEPLVDHIVVDRSRSQL